MRRWLLAVVLAACTGVRVPPAPIPVPVDASDVCARACQAASACGCPFADTGAQEQACELACRRDEAQGSASQLDPGCLARARNCGTLRACPGVGACP